MSNPIFSPSFGNRQPNSLFEMYKQVRQSNNPEQAMEKVLPNLPKYREIMQYIQNNGGDAKTAFYNMAAQKGINPEEILNLLK